MSQNATNTQPTSQMLLTPANKEVTVKSTTAARTTATSGPAAMAAELRKNKKKKAGLAAINEATSDAQLAGNPHQEREVKQNDPLAASVADTTNEASSNVFDPSIILQPIPLPSFFEESLDVLLASPSPNTSINRSQTDLLAAIQNEAVSSTPFANSYINSSANPLMITEPNLAPSVQSLREHLREVEESRNHLSNNRTNARFPTNKYTKAEMPPIHYAHPTTIFDNLDVNLVDEWANLPKGKLLAQPFGPDARNIEKHLLIKTLLFAAIIEITNSHDQAQVLLERRVWSSTAITFSVTTFNPICPRYLLSIKGLTTMNNAAVTHAVNEVWHDQDSLTFLQTICQGFPENLREQVIATLQQFVNSLEINRLDTKLRGNTIAPIYNIYANGLLIGNDTIWSKICSFYASRTYAPQTQDPGATVIAPFRCSICHAADHPRGLCPFPPLDGWNGPKRCDPIMGTAGGPGGPGGGPGPDSQRILLKK